jgi:hypothetical protein
MGYNMKRGSSPNFKELGSSPNKLGLIGGVIGAGKAALRGGNIADIYGAGVAGQFGVQGPDKETRAVEEQYQDVLKSEGLERNFWGKLGFGGGKSKEREARIAELQEQDQMGIDRDRIEARGGSVAGPA